MKINQTRLGTLLVFGIFVTTCFIPMISGMTISGESKKIDNKSLQIESNDLKTIYDLIHKTAHNNNINPFSNEHELDSDDTLYINSGFSVCETNTHDFVIAGSTGITDLSDYSASGKAMLIKTDSNGSKQWIKTYCDGEVCDGMSVDQTADSGFIISGTTISSYFPKASLIKTDEDGSQSWFETYNILDTSLATKAIETSDGGFLVTGDAASIMDPYSVYMFVLKTDQNGNVQWVETINE
jgi:hypothetical protein